MSANEERTETLIMTGMLWAALGRADPNIRVEPLIGEDGEIGNQLLVHSLIMGSPYKVTVELVKGTVEPF